MSSLFEELVTLEELPQNPTWSANLEYSKVLGAISPKILPRLTGISCIGFLISGVLFYGNRGGLPFFGVLVFGGFSAVFFGWSMIWTKDLSYFGDLKKICQGKDLVIHQECLYISGVVLVSNRQNWHFSLRDREKLRKARAHYLKIPFSRLKAFGRWRQFFSLFPAEGGAFTKYFFFDSFNEKVLEDLVTRLSEYIPQEELHHWEIPITTQVANY